MARANERPPGCLLPFLSVVFMLSLMFVPSCFAPKHVPDIHVMAAQSLTRAFERVSLRARARALRDDCSVLQVTFDGVVDDRAMVALHDGHGRVGVRAFAKKWAFTGISYVDASGRERRYGDVLEGETPWMLACTDQTTVVRR